MIAEPCHIQRIERQSLLLCYQGRSNVIIEYPSATGSKKTVSFVGSHLDVVYADKEGWQRDPFKLVIEGDKVRFSARIPLTSAPALPLLM